MIISRVGAAASDVVTLAEAKAHLRVTASDEDTLIGALVATATGMVSEMSGRVLGEEVWRWSFKPDGAMVFPRVPVVSVDEITYLDAAWDEQTATVGDFVVTADPDYPKIMPGFAASWPVTAVRDDAVTVEFTAGLTEVPAELKHAILLIVGHLYANREASTEGAMTDLPLGVEAMVALHRRGWVAA